MKNLKTRGNKAIIDEYTHKDISSCDSMSEYELMTDTGIVSSSKNK